MFPFQQSNEVSSNPHQEDFIPHNQILDTSNNPTNLMPIWDGLQSPELFPSPTTTNYDASFGCDENKNEKKKITRKEIERQRRQQMSTLHASLRSLLPLESLKGKRSISDHINEAAKYIKHLQNKVQELSVKRDKLKNSTSFDEQGNESSHDHNSVNTSNVAVRSHVGGGVEIVISCDCGEENFLPSRVIEAVVEEGFDVISCISTKRDGRLYNTIQCQASNVTCIDQAKLRQKLNDVILSLGFIS